MRDNKIVCHCSVAQCLRIGVTRRDMHLINILQMWNVEMLWLTHYRVSSAIWTVKKMQELQAKPTEPNDLNVLSGKGAHVIDAHVHWSFDLMMLMKQRKRRKAKSASEKFKFIINIDQYLPIDLAASPWLMNSCECYALTPIGGTMTSTLAQLNDDNDQFSSLFFFFYYYYFWHLFVRTRALSNFIIQT